MASGRLVFAMLRAVACAAAALTFTVAMARLLGSALLVATNCTVVAAFTLGAVKSPAPLIAPADAVHATSALLAFRTCAANWWLAPEARLKLAGEIATLTCCAGGAGLATAIAKKRRPSEACDLSVTEIENGKEPLRVGIPVMAPELRFKLSPGGSNPERTAKV